MASVLRPGEEKLFEGQPRGFPFGDFDIADVMLPEGDDMGIPSEQEEEEEEIQEETGFGNIVGMCTYYSPGTAFFIAMHLFQPISDRRTIFSV